MRGYLFLISVDAFDDLRGTARNKVIIHKLRGEVSLIEQDTIDCALCPEGAENIPLGSQASDLCF